MCGGRGEHLAAEWALLVGHQQRGVTTAESVFKGWDVPWQFPVFNDVLAEHSGHVLFRGLSRLIGVWWWRTFGSWVVGEEHQQRRGLISI